jgi:hypothetical protein
VNDAAPVPRLVHDGHSQLHRAGLIAVCVTTWLLCFHGLTVAVAHPDQMAFQPLFNAGLAPLNPGWFEKPPFHTYFNYFLSVLPVAAVGALLDLPATTVAGAQETVSKILQTLLYVGSLLLFHRVVARMVRPGVALVATALLGTSAGLVAHAHFLTADIPVLFWMLAAFACSQRVFERGAWQDYLLAGLLTGVAMATKYNGLGVGIAIPAAHFARWALGKDAALPLRQAFAPKLIVGVGFVAVGFVLANPYAVLDFDRFYGDFRYNSQVAPVYEGQTGDSYLRFSVALAESIGWPVFLATVVCGSFALAGSLRRRGEALQVATVWMAAAVLALYYAKFAPFPRLETRFVLPIAPYLLILAVPALERASARFGPAVVGLGLLVLVYNVASSVEVGHRFRSDARLAAAAWLPSGVPPRARVEVDVYSSGFGPQYACCESGMPFVTGRERLFRALFPGNEFINGSPADQAAADAPLKWFTPEALQSRRPDFIVTNSNYFGRFVEPGPRRDLYPSMRDYFEALLSGRMGYEIAYDVSTPAAPWWAYPRSIDFLQNRQIVLRRAGEP